MAVFLNRHHVGSGFMALLLTACVSSETYRQESFVGTDGGKDVYQFEVFAYDSNPPGYVDNSIAYRTRGWCPAGYDLLEKQALRSGSTTAPVGNISVTQETTTYQVRVRCK
ncbi:hypothetical protein [Thalassobius sp. I31.1]|uniref:hypothetical protein n=1 Tax=Thalassobius sp. I31.1 TaxID=2109912 RepID=UPI001300A656|nr:hypothetical protein [Thalassobius sp. I31.1]